MHLSKSARPQISSKEDKAISASSGVLRWRVFSLQASHAYCISSVCSKAVFIVSREKHGDRFTGSSVSLTLWTFSLAVSMRSFAFRSCPIRLHGLPVQAFLQYVRRQCLSWVEARRSVHRQFHLIDALDIFSRGGDAFLRVLNSAFSLPKCDEKYHRHRPSWKGRISYVRSFL